MRWGKNSNDTKLEKCMRWKSCFHLYEEHNEEGTLNEDVRGSDGMLQVAGFMPELPPRDAQHGKQAN